MVMGLRLALVRRKKVGALALISLAANLGGGDAKPFGHKDTICMYL